MTALEELIKQRDLLNEQIETLKQELEDNKLEELKSIYLDKIVKQYRKEYNDITFLKIVEIKVINDKITLLGDGVYLECKTLSKVKNEYLELCPEYDTKVVSKEEMIDEINNIMYGNFK